MIKTNNQQAIHINSNGSVTIGTSIANEKPSVSGIIESTRGGIKFPDGTIQSTASSAPDFSILTRNSSVSVPGKTCCTTASVLSGTGEIATGGGFSHSDNSHLELYYSDPITNGWSASMTNSETANRTLEVFVVCLKIQ